MPGERIRRRIDALLDEIERAEADDDWATVRSRAARVLDLDPENPDAGTFLAAALRREESDSSPRPKATQSASQGAVFPTTFVSGRYRVSRLLGEGGRKLVYLAHDERLGREVAFAQVRSTGLDAAEAERVQREARAMARLGAHPNVVTVFDVGEDQGHLYIVSEFMDGGSVADLLRETAGHGLDIATAVHLGEEVCAALEHVHSHGIVHRDLKPSNILLATDGSSRLGDFGLARDQGGPRLTAEGMMVGTFTYMSPEQAMGLPVDARSDLYSFGCVFYEMLTGRPPFLGDDAVAVALQHVNTAPVAPSWHQPGVPQSLDSLVLRLLAKAPEDRPTSAAAVRAALAAVAQDRPADRKPDTSDSTDQAERMRTGVFVGRESEMARLRLAVDDTRAGHGRLVTIVGEPGIGKTWTALEVAAYARLRGARVLWGRCYEGTEGPPYWPWIQVLRACIRDSAMEALWAEMGAAAANIAEVLSEVRASLPRLPIPQPLDPAQARFQLFDSITAFLKNASRRQPLVVVLDDLHWADEATLLLLLFLARDPGPSRLLVLATGRDVVPGSGHPLARTLADLSREQLDERLLLGGFEIADVARFIEATLGRVPPPGLATAVWKQTDGNPFFVREVVHLLALDKDLEHRDPADASFIAVPVGVQEAIGRRLADLSRVCTGLLSVAAVIGRAFDHNLLERVSEVPGDRLLEALEEASGARIIEDVKGELGRYVFSHALIRETLYGGLGAVRRARLHLRIGDELEAQYGSRSEQHATELAHHFREAMVVGGRAKFLRYVAIAARRAAARHAHEDAVAGFRSALAAKEDDPVDDETARLWVSLAKSLWALDRVDEALDLLEQAFVYYVESGDSAAAVAIAMTMEGSLVAAPRRVRLLERALPLVDEESSEGCALQAHLGGLVGLLGDDRRAQAAFAHAENPAVNREPMTELSLARWKGTVAVFHRRPVEALSQQLRTIELARELNAPPFEAAGRYYAAIESLMRGDLAAAREHADRCRALGEALGQYHWLASAAYAQASCALATGDWHAADESVERGLAVAPGDARLLLAACVVNLELRRPTDDGVGSERMARLLAADADPLGITEGHRALALPFLLRAGQPEQAAESTARAILARPAPPMAADMALAALAFLADSCPTPGEASVRYKLLARNSGTYFHVSLDHGLALLAQANGRAADALAHFDDALAFCRRGYRPAYAWAAFDFASALERCDPRRSGSRARELRAEALAIAQELRMRTLETRIALVAGASARECPALPDGLSERKAEVLRLIADGQSNKQIADAMVISVRTVERHIANAYAKIGARTKSQATAYAIRHGLG